LYGKMLFGEFFAFDVFVGDGDAAFVRPNAARVARGAGTQQRTVAAHVAIRRMPGGNRRRRPVMADLDSPRQDWVGQDSPLLEFVEEPNEENREKEDEERGEEDRRHIAQRRG